MRRRTPRAGTTRVSSTSSPADPPGHRDRAGEQDVEAGRGLTLGVDRAAGGVQLDPAPLRRSSRAGRGSAPRRGTSSAARPGRSRSPSRYVVVSAGPAPDPSGVALMTSPGSGARGSRPSPPRRRRTRPASPTGPGRRRRRTPRGRWSPAGRGRGRAIQPAGRRRSRRGPGPVRTNPAESRSRTPVEPVGQRSRADEDEQV